MSDGILPLFGGIVLQSYEKNAQMAIKMLFGVRYFSRMNIAMGVPWNSHCSRILFSK